MTGKQYRAIREELGLTQEQLAAEPEIGVTSSTVARREQRPDDDVSAEAATAILAVRRRRAELAEAVT